MRYHFGKGWSIDQPLYYRSNSTGNSLNLIINEKKIKKLS